MRKIVIINYIHFLKGELKINQYGQLLIYKDNEGNNQIEVKLFDNSIWLTQDQIVNLYQSSKSNISEHIKHILEEGELDENSVVRKYRTTASDGKMYNYIYIGKCMIKLLYIDFKWSEIA